eukprot:gene4220-8396_t
MVSMYIFRGNILILILATAFFVHGYRFPNKNIIIHQMSFVDFSDSGIEYSILSMGNSRTLLRNEYELSFLTFNDLKKNALNKKWPVRNMREWECAILDSVLLSTVPTSSDVDVASMRFRKTILGLEKYRINNPQLMAQKYSEFLRTCLNIGDDSWGVAANAIEYAGLKFRDHVIKQDTMPRLLLTSLWNRSLDILLDIKLISENNDSVEDAALVPITWDQKFFSQAEMGPGGVEQVQDMMLYLCRLACRAVLSGEEVEYMQVMVPTVRPNPRSTDTASATTTGNPYIPPSDATTLVLALSFQIQGEKQTIQDNDQDVIVACYS